MKIYKLLAFNRRFQTKIQHKSTNLIKSKYPLTNKNKTFKYTIKSYSQFVKREDVNVLRQFYIKYKSQEEKEIIQRFFCK